MFVTTENFRNNLNFLHPTSAIPTFSMLLLDPVLNFLTLNLPSPTNGRVYVVETVKVKVDPLFAMVYVTFLVTTLRSSVIDKSFFINLPIDCPSVTPCTLNHST